MALNFQDLEVEEILNRLARLHLGHSFENARADLSSPVFNSFRERSERRQGSDNARAHAPNQTNTPAENRPAAATGPAAGLQGAFGLATGPPRFTNLGPSLERFDSSVLSGAMRRAAERPMGEGAGQAAQPAPQPGTGNTPADGDASQPGPSTPRGGQKKHPTDRKDNPGGLLTPPSSPEGETAVDSGRTRTPSTTISCGPASTTGTEVDQDKRKDGSGPGGNTEKLAGSGTPAEPALEPSATEPDLLEGRENKRGSGERDEKEEGKEKGKEKEKSERTPEEPRAVLTRRAERPLGPPISWKTSLRDSRTESSHQPDSSGGIPKSQGHRSKRATTKAINTRCAPSGPRASGPPSSPDPPHLASLFQRVFEDYFEERERQRPSALPPDAGATVEPSDPFASRPSAPPRPASPVPAASAEHTRESELISNPSNPRAQVPPSTDDTPSRRRPSTIPGPQPSEPDAPESARQRLWSLSGRVARRIGSYVGRRGLGLVASAAACVAAGLLARAAMSRGNVYEYVLVNEPKMWYAGD